MPLSEKQEMAALRQRFAKPSAASAIYLAAVVVATNGYLLYLVTSGEASRVGLALYGVLELIAYSVISNLTMLTVPKELRVGTPDVPMGTRIAMIVAIGAVLSGIAWLGVHGDAEHLRKLDTAHDPLAALADLNVLRPLLLTVLLAIGGSLGDWLRWRSSGGGPFVNGLAMSAAPKFLTAVIAPIVALLASDSIHDAARATFVWCGVYLAIKCALELLLLVWQTRGMPEQPKRA